VITARDANSLIARVAIKIRLAHVTRARDGERAIFCGARVDDGGGAEVDFVLELSEFLRKFFLLSEFFGVVGEVKGIVCTCDQFLFFGVSFNFLKKKTPKILRDHKNVQINRFLKILELFSS
jgi:hypothetical protein